MPRLYVCPLRHILEVAESVSARDMITLINPDMPVERPPQIAPDRHLDIRVSDIADPKEGYIAPDDAHLTKLLRFAAQWRQETPLLIHCWAGVSRSTAAAYIALCSLAPERDEAEIAQALRAASPTATPNPRLIAIADEMLGRGGRMRAAIAAIGRGAECFEGEPFALDVKIVR